MPWARFLTRQSQVDNQNQFIPYTAETNRTMLPRQHTLDTPYLIGPVHAYSLEHEGELILFDTGPPKRQTREVLTREIDLEQLKYVLISHCHVDHYGQARWLETVSDATIYLPYRDHLRIQNHAEHLRGMRQVVLETGFDEDFAKLFMDLIVKPNALYPEFPQNYKVIEEDLPQHLSITTLACPGHSQSDLAICGADWAVTGDVMLREIFQSPLLDIDLETGTRFDNYGAYCGSLLNIAKLRDKTILPGHREFIVSVDNNLTFYLSKMFDRAAKLKKFPTRLTPAQVVEKLFGIDTKYPFASYSKASEITFLRDFLNDPEPLIESIKDIGLYSQIADKLESVIL
jgi:2,4-dienoyl-CoA reductase (NADPH2)